MKKFMLLFLAFTAAAGCSVQDEAQEDARETAAGENKRAEIIADQLDIPWSLNFSSGVLYLSERTGSIVKVEGEKKTRMKTELEKPFADAAEAGLLGLALHPDFLENRKAFAYYTYDNDGKAYNRLIELQLDKDTWKERKTLLDKIPGGPVHQGGRIEIGPDQKLYATAGDASEDQIAQDPEQFGGKILRMNLDGTIPEDNPFEHSYVFSYGHRNPQGISWTADEVMYSTEHGPSGYDEINRIEPGGNYGWPAITGDEKKENMKTPIAHSGNYSWAPSGSAISGETLYYGGLGGQGIYKFQTGSEKVEKVLSGYGRIRDVLLEGDHLYFITNNTDGRGNPKADDDKLYKISLKELSS
ncbi:PQQ-dependent sugar dehydrogenase [Metabacillus sp. 84]|uniref:PQQ-dependent sugar dehydrogenase n=1 Tax=unclassified Metabacillus TaxID=2675274 RepID=UPI003CF8612A